MSAVPMTERKQRQQKEEKAHLGNHIHGPAHPKVEHQATGCHDDEHGGKEVAPFSHGIPRERENIHHLGEQDSLARKHRSYTRPTMHDSG